jgi:hypothetical protein
VSVLALGQAAHPRFFGCDDQEIGSGDPHLSQDV